MLEVGKFGVQSRRTPFFLGFPRSCSERANSYCFVRRVRGENSFCLVNAQTLRALLPEPGEGAEQLFFLGGLVVFLYEGEPQIKVFRWRPGTLSACPLGVSRSSVEYPSHSKIKERQNLRCSLCSEHWGFDEGLHLPRIHGEQAGDDKRGRKAWIKVPKPNQ